MDLRTANSENWACVNIDAIKQQVAGGVALPQFSVDNDVLHIQIRGVNYEIVPREEIKMRLDNIMANPETALRGRDRLYFRIKDLKLVGISKRDIEKYLAKDRTHQIHTPLKPMKVRAPILTQRPLERFQADIIEFSDIYGANNRRRYALTVIDCFSKYAWVRMMTMMTLPKTKDQLGPILRQYTPSIIQTDNGGQFTGKEMLDLYAELGIKHLKSFPYKPSTNGCIERFNKTIKSAIYQYLTAANTKKFIDVLDKLVENYNNAYHTAIKNKPNEVFFTALNPRGVGERRLVRKTKRQLDANAKKMLVRTGRKYSQARTGMYVRLAIIREDSDEREMLLHGFKKHYKPNYSKDIYRITSVSAGKPDHRPQYLLEQTHSWDIRNKILTQLPAPVLINNTFYRDDLLVLRGLPRA